MEQTTDATVHPLYEPNIWKLHVSGPGLGNSSTFDRCDIDQARSEIHSDASVVQFQIIATGAEARVLFDRLAARSGEA